VRSSTTAQAGGIGGGTDRAAENPRAGRYTKLPLVARATARDEGRSLRGKPTDERSRAYLAITST
jgi:hypothetical protein